MKFRENYEMRQLQKEEDCSDTNEAQYEIHDRTGIPSDYFPKSQIHYKEPGNNKIYCESQQYRPYIYFSFPLFKSRECIDDNCRSGYVTDIAVVDIVHAIVTY